MSHALWATWQRRSGLRLTVAGYRATGGISQAIATTADAIYRQLDEAGRDALRKMLPRLVLVGDEMVDTARPLDRTVLLHGLSDRDAAEVALGRFVEARLVTLDQDTARISHEALLHAWPLFQEWIQADREWLRTHQRLAADARAWREAGRDPALLYRGSRLAAVREQATRTTQAGELEQPLADFLDRSSREELRAGRRRNMVIAVLTMLLLVATTGGLGAVIFQRQAIGERNRATARLVAAEAESLRDVQPGLSKQLSAVAYRLDPDIGSASVFDGEQLPGTLDSQEPVIDMALTRDGRVLAISTGTSIALWDTSGRALGRVGEVSAGPVALSSDGRLLAAGVTLAGDAHPNGEVRLWNVKDPYHVRQIASLPSDTSRVAALAISPDDRVLVAGTAEGAIRVWDITDPQATKALPSLQGHTAGVDSVTFAPRERLLASSSLDHTVRLWDLTKLEQAAMVSSMAESSSTAIRRRPMILHRLAFSPVGPFLATVSGKGPFEYPQVWDISQHSNPRSVASIPPDEMLASCFNIVQAVAFSSSGGTLVESCQSGAWLWQFVAAKDLASSGALPVHTSTANGAVLFSPERQQLLHATDNGVLLWEVTAARRPGALVSLPGPGGFNTNISFSGAGRLLMAVGGNDSAQLWDVTDPRRPRILIQLPAAGPVGGAVALSPDGAVFAARGRDHDLPLVLLHSTSHPDGDPVATISDLDNGVASLAFSRDGRTLAVADNLDFTPDIRKPPTVKLYDIHDLAHPLRVAVLAAGAYQLAFSPNGHLLSAGGTDQLLGWTLTDRGHPVELTAHRLTAGSVVAGVAYRPDGALLAVGDSAKTVRMWRIDDDQLIGEPKILRGNLDASQLGFSGDGRTLAMIGNDPTFDQSWVELWRVDGDVPVFQARLARSSSLSLKTFAYSADGRILATLGSQPDYVELWDTSPQHAASAICASAGDAISRAQWDRYVGNLPYQPPCAASTH
ncbi:MAG: WD40 repeat domain-containing protein [Candidatus Dormibacteraeota bacterium]|nr:WD40 repeat domain-containing protein [Candidatus Dormibacteraeota bacterium]